MRYLLSYSWKFWSFHCINSTDDCRTDSALVIGDFPLIGDKQAFLVWIFPQNIYENLYLR